MDQNEPFQVFQGGFGELEFRRTAKRIDIDSIPWQQSNAFPQHHAHLPQGTAAGGVDHRHDNFEWLDDKTNNPRRVFRKTPTRKPREQPVSDPSKTSEREQPGAISRHAEQASSAPYAPRNISHEEPLKFNRCTKTEGESKTPWIDIMREHRARRGEAAREGREASRESEEASRGGRSKERKTGGRDRDSQGGEAAREDRSAERGGSNRQTLLSRVIQSVFRSWGTRSDSNKL
jgi:hypothetical protein